MLHAIVLAAGMSRRMGKENKLLLPLAGKTMLETTIGNLMEAGIDGLSILVVTGHEAERVRAAIQHLPVMIIHNPSYEQGMTSSIQAGVRAAVSPTDTGRAITQLPGTVRADEEKSIPDGYMICLADMPWIKSADYALLAAAFRTRSVQDPKFICLPGYGPNQGNPVIFSSFYRHEILACENPEGCRDIVRANGRSVYRVMMPDDTILKDIDGPDDYRSFRDD